MQIAYLFNFQVFQKQFKQLWLQVPVYCFLRAEDITQGSANLTLIWKQPMPLPDIVLVALSFKSKLLSVLQKEASIPFLLQMYEYYWNNLKNF